MIGALWTGISGLSSQQQALDNESNNIANVNTIGYKASRISFADQMYQDRIGKGSKILDAEKLYTQGNLKLTGVNYDMALSGDGFFTVVNTRNSGASETLYTRAGNFRMGDNGTLQDAAGNEVQGWMMSPIDSQNDVTSTNPNVSVFNTNYNKLLGTKIIRHGTYVETITAKATDYTTSAKSDTPSIFSGDGSKTKSSKISDVEEAIKDYTFWLQKLKDEPDASSATSISQISQINFKSGTDSIISKDGDQIYVYINGNKISQNFLLTSAGQGFREDLWNSLGAAGQAAEPAANGLVNPVPEASLTEAQRAAYDKAASKIATYKALADKISQIPGLVATMAVDSGRTDAFDVDETYIDSTNNGDMLKGIMQIKSLIPGKEFTISEVAEESSGTTIQGNFQTQSSAQKGSGIAALETSRDA
ncbi:flagellar hook basal-body protein, partial [Arcobacter cloacae]